MLYKRTKKPANVSGEPTSESEALVESAVHDEKLNGDCEVSKEIAQDEPCSMSEKPTKMSEGKGRRELKPPRVLEVLYRFSIIADVTC